MRTLIRTISKYISIANNYSIDQEEVLEYSIRVFTFEIIKILGILIIFSLWGFSLQAIIIVITMSTTKPFLGGYHEDTQLKCFAATLIIVGSIIYLSNNITIDLISKLILNLIIIFCIWQQIPIVNPKMDLTKEELIKRNRIVGIFFAIVYLVISILFYKVKTLSDTIVWVLLYQALLLFNKRK